MAVIDNTNTPRLAKKLAKALRKSLLSKMPWARKKAAYEELSAVPEAALVVPDFAVDTDESAENALNEALEARLMELIACSPAQETHVTLRLGCVVVPADPDSVLVSLDAHMQTKCQVAEAQQPPKQHAQAAEVH
jgi:hypothetical protein